MTSAKLEHVNVTVSDSRASAKLYCELFGWKVRWHGEAINGGYTYHVGTDDQYVALYSSTKESKEKPGGYEIVGRLNHIAVVVDDIDAMDERIKAAGYKTFNHGDYEPGRRFYFYDDDDIEIEVVSYL
ncbi:MAG: VOC family protein [Marinicaulis sp.]|nr:VOC family protein [Marinicaulis sp.]NNL88925.1 VOC family protein [Marinicaulis sp.]